MKTQKMLLLFGASALLLASCSDAGTDNRNENDTQTDSVDLIEKASEKSTGEYVEQANKEKEDLEKVKPIEFTYGVANGTSETDSDNYMDVEGYARGSTQVVVVYNGTVVDVLTTDDDGFFYYYNKANDTETDLIFGTNSDATYGDSLSESDIENAIKVTVIPQEKTNDNFTIGETAYFESGIEITVTNVTTTDELPNGDIFGNFVRVDVVIDNQTGEALDFNGHLVELYDGDRNKAELNSKDFFSESIASGMKANGSVYFDSIEEGPFTVIIGAGIWISE